MHCALPPRLFLGSLAMISLLFLPTTGMPMTDHVAWTPAPNSFVLAGVHHLRRAAESTVANINFTAYPDAVTQLNQTFQTIMTIPNAILAQGDNATARWLAAHQPLRPESWWHDTECALAIITFLGANLIAAAKIIKIKDYIEALGGVYEAVELMVKCSTVQEMLREGGAALVNLVAEILGIPAIAKACS